MLYSNLGNFQIALMALPKLLWITLDSHQVKGFVRVVHCCCICTNLFIDLAPKVTSDFPNYPILQKILLHVDTCDESRNII